MTNHETCEAPQTPYFNPPTASEMTDEDDALPVFSLRRVSTKIDHLSVTSNGQRSYHRRCARARCMDTVPVYRVVTGTVNGIEQSVYYFPDDAIVLEIGYTGVALVTQVPFCTYRCLALWAKWLLLLY